MVSPHELEQHRNALTGHCYRMMGSAADADDAVQETMVRAWRGLDGFEQRASLRMRILRHTDLVAQFPVLDAYPERCEARPAFQKALADQTAAFSP